MRIEVQRNETSQALIYDNVINAYTKGNMYCVLFVNNGVKEIHKFPLSSIFRIVEPYVSKREGMDYPNLPPQKPSRPLAHYFTPVLTDPPSFWGGKKEETPLDKEEDNDPTLSYDEFALKLRADKDLSISNQELVLLKYRAWAKELKNV